MKVRFEKKKSFYVCGMKGFAEQRDEVQERFWGKDEGDRFSALIGAQKGYYGLIWHDKKPEDSDMKSYLFGKDTYPTVYKPKGGVQKEIPEATYLVARFYVCRKNEQTLFEKSVSAINDHKQCGSVEQEDITVKEAWERVLSEFLPKDMKEKGYEIDTAHGICFEYYPVKPTGSFELWIPIRDAMIKA